MMTTGDYTKGAFAGGIVGAVIGGVCLGALGSHLLARRKPEVAACHEPTSVRLGLDHSHPQESTLPGGRLGQEN